MITQQDIQEVYGQLVKAIQVHGEAELEAINAKNALEVAKYSGIAVGTITGRNNEEREAKARELFGAIYKKVEEAEIAAKKTRIVLDMAQTEKSRVQATLRLMELTQTSVQK